MLSSLYSNEVIFEGTFHPSIYTAGLTMDPVKAYKCALEYPKEFIQFVKSQTKKVLLDNEIDMILSVIDASRLEPSFETDKRHKAYVKSLFDEK